MDVLEHDELSRAEALVARVALGPRREWNPDVAIRYLPIVRIVRAHGLADAVTEVGSGPVGIGPYLRRPFTGVDTALPAPRHRLLEPVEASVLETGFAPRSRPCVVSTDMLEHLPRRWRQAAVTELARIAGALLVVAVPCGAAAEAHDRETAELFRQVRGVDHRFLLEHVEYGLPTAEELNGYVIEALRAVGRTATVRVVPNASLRVRRFVMRRWIRRRLVDQVGWLVLTWLSAFLARRDREPCYRRTVIVEFTDGA
jgi:hypothetical protein